MHFPRPLDEELPALRCRAEDPAVALDVLRRQAAYAVRDSRDALHATTAVLQQSSEIVARARHLLAGRVGDPRD